ncbi:transmembrane protein 236 [Osmerus eperlanus]|uniref:transmembrane protein 236 n=1 Tax=Osmerus eperlanus TaxID=29151 RepID=UPI002E11BA0B
MLRGRTIKLVLYEVLQFAALSVPVFVVMERFAALMRHVRGGDLTAYWLVVAASIAYVTSVTLLVWVPLKYLIIKQRRCITEITQWRPTTLAYVLLATLPCFAIIIASSKVQVDRGLRYDPLTELPVSLVFLSLICVDIIERIRPCRLTGKVDSLEFDLDIPGPVLTHLEQVSTVAGQLYSDRVQNGSPAQPDNRNGTATERWGDRDQYSLSATSSRPASAAYLYSSSGSPSGLLRFLWARDTRSEVVVDSFLFWMDTVEMVRVAGEPAVFFSGWVIPVYILAYLSMLRLVITPHNALLSSAGFVTQDFPFLVVRIALIIVFGYVTPVLYPVKNLMVCLAYIYFNFLTKLKLFGRESMF